MNKNLIKSGCSAFDALKALNEVPGDTTLFIADNEGTIIGSLTDGDLRRSLLLRRSLEEPVDNFMNPDFHFLVKGEISLEKLEKLRKLKLRLVPILNSDGKLYKFINLTVQRSMLPIDAVFMAGGEGKRLLPLTEKIPKPLLKVGDKPILEHNIDRLSSFGVENFNICVRHFAQQIVDYFGDGTAKGISVKYVIETEPLGTIGAISMVDDFNHDVVLIMNSDLLTNIDFELFLKDFQEKDADISVASVSYKIEIPYAIFETEGHQITSIREKPDFNYYTNAGIYLVKRSVLSKYIDGGHQNATDLVERVLKDQGKVIYFPILGYWLDIGRHEDFRKAQEDIRHIRL